MTARLSGVMQHLARGGLRRAVPFLVLAAVVVFLRVTAPAPHAGAAAPTETPSPTVTYQWRPYAPGYGPNPTPTASPTAGRPEAQLALRFVTAWLDTSGGRQAWLARLQPMAAQDLADGLALTNLADVPHGAAGAVLSVTPTRTGDATVVVGTTAGDVRLYVARRNAGDTWQVNTIEPATSGAR